MYTLEKLKVKAAKPIIRLGSDKLFKETNLVVGKESILNVSSILIQNKIDNVLIITSPSIIRLELIKPLLESLKQNNIRYSIYKEITSDPSFIVVNQAIAIAKREHCQSVIGIGGGSVLDVAKTVAACCGNNYVAPSSLVGTMKVRKQPLFYIAAPTTAGTGSEVTAIAVISDPISHKKLKIIDPKLIADYTILDANLTSSLPSNVVATTGLDALTHALEAYVSTYATPETDKLALKAVKLLTDNLELAYKKPEDLKAREQLLLGSMFAGLAFTRTSVGYVHAFSHNIGALYGTAHGLSNAILLPHVMNDIKESSIVRFAQLSDFIVLTDKWQSNRVKADALISYLHALNISLGIPPRFEQFDKYEIDKIIEGTFKEAHGTYPVPKYYTKEEARNLLLQVCVK